MLFLNGVENPAPVDDGEKAEGEQGAEDAGASEDAGNEGSKNSTAGATDGEAASSSKRKAPKRAKGEKTMKKGKTTAKAAKATKPAKAAKGGKAVKAKSAKANGHPRVRDGAPSKMSQAIAFMQAERNKLDDPKDPPRGFRKELIEKAAKKFGLAVATCSTQYGAKVHA